jgi:hypothetical protein
MTIKKRMVLPLALALGALGMMVMATAANATHPRPKGASPLRASMVPAYKACTVPDRTHGPPLAFPSCAVSPPVTASPWARQTSGSLTVGSPDTVPASGAANSVGFLRIAVIPGVVGPPDDSDVKLELSITDVRCIPGAGVAACDAVTPNAAGGLDYTGEVQGTAEIRITDHWNAVAAGGGPDAATVVAIPFPVTSPCAVTALTSIGSKCSITTFANAVVPGAVKDTKRAIVETGTAAGMLRVDDGGLDGVMATTPNTLFETVGIFIP